MKAASRSCLVASHEAETKVPAVPNEGRPSPLPHLYAPWVEEVLGGPVPEEHHATCSTCAMCQPASSHATTASLRTFDPGAKCCTYIPTLPNFLVGMVLGDHDPAAASGRVSVERRLGANIGVTPLGLQSDPHYALIYRHAGGDLFGRASGLRCPHYVPTDGGQCGIWRHRNAVCATWFCKLERGAVSKRFWNAMLRLLSMSERHLALWAASELGQAINGLGPALLPYYATALDGPATTWSQRWAGRPQEFFLESARLVQPLSWTEVRAIGGPELALVAGQLRAAYGALKTEDVPALLRLGAVETLRLDDCRSALAGYSPNDMLVLPTQLADSLDQFDGRQRTDSVLVGITNSSGLSLDRVTLRQLVDFGLLLEMPSSRRNGTGEQSARHLEAL